LDTSHLIDFLGYTPDVYFWYNRARISVVSSEREGFPYSVMESLSCGCPVIASNCGDITDILIHGVNGMIVDDYSDHPAFAGEIMKILDQPSRLLELRRNTVKSVEKVNREAVSRVWAGIMEGLQR
jgi:glycosyltransferase involved in cell wall biosynthesis